MSREELLAQMAAAINYSLEDAADEVYPGRHRKVTAGSVRPAKLTRPLPLSADPKVLAHWTRRRYELATHLLAEVKAGEAALAKGRRIHLEKKAEDWHKENADQYVRAMASLSAAEVLSPEVQPWLPTK